VEEVDNTKQFAAPWVKMLITHLHFFHHALLLFPISLKSACIHMLIYDKAEIRKVDFLSNQELMCYSEKA